MNKTDLTAKIAEGAGLTKVDAKKALDATLDAITAAVKAGVISAASRAMVFRFVMVKTG